MTQNELLIKCLRIRRVEEAISKLYPTDKIQSPVHLSNGQEYAAVGVCAALVRSDLVFGTYRGHALYLAKGGDLNSMFAELFGKETGFAKGRAGSMHLADAEAGVMGSSAIVASTIPHAVGSAYAAKIQKKDQIIACFFGEGATGEGAYHESLNFASKHKLPLLFVCENNGLAINAVVNNLHSFDVSEHAKTYGIESFCIENGSDVTAIFEATRELVSSIKKMNGPMLLEIKTNRLMEHVGHNRRSDFSLIMGSLRTHMGHDPLTEMRFEFDVEHKIKMEIDAAIMFAETSAYPAEISLLDFVT